MEQDKLSFINENILRLKYNVSELSVKSGRKADEVTIIGVTKKFPAEYAQVAFESGLNNLGENRVEELLEKQDYFMSKGLYPNWHMIGTLQRKKVKKIAGRVHLIHSVDSIKLANEISKESLDDNFISSVLLQVNTSGEETKQGFSKQDILRDISEISGLKGVAVKGLMTMAPFTDDRYILEKVFSDTYDLFSIIKELAVFPDMRILSMGMSNDYHLAIRYGSTHIRLGTAIFGERI